MLSIAIFASIVFLSAIALGAGPFSGKNIRATWTPSGGSAVVIANVTQFSVNPTADLQAYSSSSTAGRKKRVAGVGDATASVTVLATDSTTPGDLITEGAEGTLTLIEDNTQAASTAHVLACRLADWTSEVDADSGAIVGITANFEGNGTYTPPAR